MNLPAPLLLVTARRMARRPLLDLLDWVLAAGCRWLLLREKDLPDHQLAGLLGQVQKLARPYGAIVALSAAPQVARACDAPILHLPWGASVQAARAIVGRGVRIGLSTHSPREAEAATAAGADYITLSPIFPSLSKPGYGPPLGLETLERVAACLPIPVVALGGITDRNAAPCLWAGAAAVAVMGAVMGAAEPGGATGALLRAIQQQPDQTRENPDATAIACSDT